MNPEFVFTPIFEPDRKEPLLSLEFSKFIFKRDQKEKNFYKTSSFLKQTTKQME